MKKNLFENHDLLIFIFKRNSNFCRFKIHENKFMNGFLARDVLTYTGDMLFVNTYIFTNINVYVLFRSFLSIAFYLRKAWQLIQSFQ